MVVHEGYLQPANRPPRRVRGPIAERLIAPTKVTRTALQNSNSIASLFLTTEAVVTEKPQPKSGVPAMPGGGGMY